MRTIKKLFNINIIIVWNHKANGRSFLLWILERIQFGPLSGTLFSSIGTLILRPDWVLAAYYDPQWEKNDELHANWILPTKHMKISQLFLDSHHLLRLLYAIQSPISEDCLKSKAKAFCVRTAKLWKRRNYKKCT